MVPDPQSEERESEPHDRQRGREHYLWRFEVGLVVLIACAGVLMLVGGVLAFPIQEWKDLKLILFGSALLVSAFLHASDLRRRATVKLRRSRGQCVYCGYSLQGITSDVCPECGKSIKLRPWEVDPAKPRW